MYIKDTDLHKNVFKSLTLLFTFPRSVSTEHLALPTLTFENIRERWLCVYNQRHTIYIFPPACLCNICQQL